MLRPASKVHRAAAAPPAAPASDRSRTPAPSRRARFLAAVSALLTVAGMFVLFAPAASAAIASHGPLDPASKFPSFYTDAKGLSLQLCQDGAPSCLSGPQTVQDIHAAGGDAEAFY